MMRLLTLLCGASVLLAACGAGTPSAGTVPFDREFTLASGDRLGTNELGVTFDRVSADSRCPADVQCIWEGDAVVALSVTVKDVACSLELHTAGGLPHAATCGGYRFELRELVPAPASAASPIPAGEYRATLLVTLSR